MSHYPQNVLPSVDSSEHVPVQAEPSGGSDGTQDINLSVDVFPDAIHLVVAPVPNTAHNNLLYENALDTLNELRTLDTIQIDLTRLDIDAPDVSFNDHHEASNFLVHVDGLLSSQPADALVAFEMKLPVRVQLPHIFTESFFQGNIPPCLKRLDLYGCRLPLDSPILRATTLTSLSLDGPSDIFNSVDDVIEVLRGLPNLTTLRLGLDHLDPPASNDVQTVALPFAQAVYIGSTASVVAFLLDRLLIPMSADLNINCNFNAEFGLLSMEMVKLGSVLRARYADHRQKFSYLIIDMEYNVQNMGAPAIGINIVLDIERNSDYGALSVGILWERECWKPETLIAILPCLPIAGIDFLALTNVPFISTENWAYLFKNILPCSIETIRVEGPSALCGLTLALQLGQLFYLQTVLIDSVNFLAVDDSDRFRGMDLLERFVEALQWRKSRRIWSVDEVQLSSCAWHVQMVEKIESEIAGHCSWITDDGLWRTLTSSDAGATA